MWTKSMSEDVEGVHSHPFIQPKLNMGYSALSLFHIGRAKIDERVLYSQAVSEIGAMTRRRCQAISLWAPYNLASSLLLWSALCRLAGRYHHQSRFSGQTSSLGACRKGSHSLLTPRQSNIPNKRSSENRVVFTLQFTDLLGREDHSVRASKHTRLRILTADSEACWCAGLLDRPIRSKWRRNECRQDHRR